jgi:O-acetyl-ADP-ribose deacetylase (regulator of RNase III)
MYMQLRNKFSLETDYGIRTLELYEGDLTKLSEDVDVLALSAFSGWYTPSRGTVIGALHTNLNLSIKDLAAECVLDLRKALSIWISTPLHGLRFKRILCVEINGSPLHLADILENLFVGIATLEAKGMEIRSIALPSLGTGLQKQDPRQVMHLLLPKAQQALERSHHLARILLVGKNPERVDVLNTTMTEILKRPWMSVPPDQGILSPQEESLTKMNIFRQKGEVWDIAYQGHSFSLKHIKGLSYIAYLLRHQTQQFAPLQLIQGIGERVSVKEYATYSSKSKQGLAEQGLYVSSIGDYSCDVEAPLDKLTFAQCLQQLKELKAQKEEAEQFNDYGQVEKLQEQIEKISAYLCSSKFSTISDRSRISVTKRIHSAIENIRSHNNELARHLSHYIKTGYKCSYNPDPTNPITWSF